METVSYAVYWGSVAYIVDLVEVVYLLTNLVWTAVAAGDENPLWFNYLWRQFFNKLSAKQSVQIHKTKAS